MYIYISIYFLGCGRERAHTSPHVSAKLQRSWCATSNAYQCQLQEMQKTFVRRLESYVHTYSESGRVLVLTSDQIWRCYHLQARLQRKAALQCATSARQRPALLQHQTAATTTRLTLSNAQNGPCKGTAMGPGHPPRSWRCRARVLAEAATVNLRAQQLQPPEPPITAMARGPRDS